MRRFVFFVSIVLGLPVWAISEKIILVYVLFVLRYFFLSVSSYGIIMISSRVCLIKRNIESFIQVTTRPLEIFSLNLYRCVVYYTSVRSWTQHDTPSLKGVITVSWSINMRRRIFVGWKSSDEVLETPPTFRNTARTELKVLPSHPLPDRARFPNENWSSTLWDLCPWRGTHHSISGSTVDNRWKWCFLSLWKKKSGWYLVRCWERRHFQRVSTEIENQSRSVFLQYETRCRKEAPKQYTEGTLSSCNLCLILLTLPLFCSFYGLA